MADWAWCEHEWVEKEDIGNNEYKVMVVCKLCDCPGEKYYADGTVDWPAT